jgi:signal transduction histidine kinase
MAQYSKEEQKVIDIHNLFWEALAMREIELRFSLCADDVTFIGTGLHERAKNKEEYKKIGVIGVEQSPKPFQTKFLWIQLTVLGNVSWVESEIEWVQKINEILHKELVRTTTILKLEHNQWEIIHVHGSSPDYRFLNGDYMSNEGTISKNKELERQVFERTQQLNESLEILKSAQSQLIQSEKMASLGELTAGIAHEIQNPLNFVNNFSEVNTELIDEMKEEIEKGNLEKAKAIANDIADNEKMINNHGKRADAIVKGMLQHSRISNGVKVPTDINALADEYLRLAYHGLRAKNKSFNATLKTDFDKSIGNINIIPQDIGRVILNLINNAFYACAERRLLSEAETNRSAVNEKKHNRLVNNFYEPYVSIITKKLADKVLVSINDNGSGIPQKLLDKIFQPFFTTKPTGQGTGLGLSLSYDIVKAHGGELKVESELNTADANSVNTRFTIVLPYKNN